MKTKGTVLTEEDELCVNFEKVLVAAKRANFRKNVFKISLNSLQVMRTPRPNMTI